MKTKNTLILIFLVLSALVLSALIGTITENIGFLKWLTWGDSIGFDTVNLDLSIINLSFVLYADKRAAGGLYRRRPSAFQNPLVRKETVSDGRDYPCVRVATPPRNIRAPRNTL